jgi:hypothetical protein
VTEQQIRDQFQNRFKPETIKYFEDQNPKGTQAFLEVYRKQLLGDIESKRNVLIEQNKGERMVSESKQLVEQMVNKFEVDMDSILEEGQYLLEPGMIENKCQSLSEALLTRLHREVEAKVGADAASSYILSFSDKTRGRVTEIITGNRERVEKALEGLKNAEKRAEALYWAEMDSIQKSVFFRDSVLKKHGEVRDQVIGYFERELDSGSYPDWLKNQAKSAFSLAIERAFEKFKFLGDVLINDNLLALLRKFYRN